MIAVEEARRIMMAQVRCAPSERVALAAAGSRFVVQDVIAPFDHPLFDMSAVDGYALAFGEGVNEWKVVGEIAAGEEFPGTLKPGDCTRIFTGAMVPAGADTVLMQEYAARSGDRIAHSDLRLKVGSNVRRKGDQLRRGQLVLGAGQRMNAAAKGLLASVGVSSVEVIPLPRVAVIITGNEFADERTMRPGMIFGSNDVMLADLVALAEAVAEIHHVPDVMAALEQTITQGLMNADILITTGGASVGDHDLIRPVLERLGATIHFHGVAQKPGKPMLFATLNGKPILGLPGNPRAVLVLFWEYVLPFLHAMQGAAHPVLPTDRLPIAHGITINGDRAEFRAAGVREGKVTLLADEGSHMLRSLVEADALAYLPADKRLWRAGESVEVHYLPK